MTTFLELQDAVFAYTQQSPTRGICSQDEVKRWINQGHQRMFVAVAEQFEGFCQVEALSDETEDQSEYALPEDLYRLLGVERIKESGGSILGVPYFLHKIEYKPAEIDYARSSQPATHNRLLTADRYYQIGQEKIMLTTPSPSTVTASLRINYIYRPADMVADIDEPFQQTAGQGGPGKVNLVEFHDIIEYMALERAFQKEEALDQSREMKFMYQSRLQDLHTFLDNLNVQEPRFINYTDDEDGILW